MQVTILGLLEMTQLQCPMGCYGHHSILCNPNRFIFEDNKNIWYSVVPLNNFASMNNCPCVEGKSKSPLPLPRCVCGGGGEYLFHDFTSIFKFINIHEYANEIILFMTIVWKDLSICITDDIKTYNKDSLGQNSVYICFFIYIISPYFLKFSSVLMNMQIR